MERCENKPRNLARDVLLIIALAICFCAVSLALVWSKVSVERHAFATGAVDLNLNDGEPVIRAGEFVFEPGMDVEKSFFIENDSSWDVYYKFYLDDVEGGLADTLVVTIKDDGQTLYSGCVRDLTRQSVAAADDVLEAGERRWLTIDFYLPEEASNDAQGADLSFTLCAEATQAKNNPDKAFE